MHEDRVRIRDLPPLSIRLRPALRDELVRASLIHNRSLSGEITARLEASLANPELVHRVESARSRAQRQGVVAEPTPPPVAPQLGELQRALLKAFDTLAPDKQLALLTLLKR